MSKASPRNSEIPRTQLGARLHLARQLTGLRQSDIADAIGCSAFRISLIERGRGRFSLEEAHILAELLGCAAEELLP